MGLKTNEEKDILVVPELDVFDYGKSAESSRRPRISLITILTIIALVFLSATLLLYTVVFLNALWIKPFNSTCEISTQPQCDNIPESQRFDCFPETYLATKDKCEARGCCWWPFLSKPGMLGKVPWCFYSRDYQGYIVDSVNRSATGMTAMLSRSTKSGWPNDVMTLQVDVNFESYERLHFKIYDPHNSRYEVPLKLSPASKAAWAPDYDVSIADQGPFSLTVTRKSTGQKVFDTSGTSPLIFADQFIQISTVLSSPFLYGLGEHQDSFLISTNWTKLVLWNVDQPPERNVNLYGFHPFYLNVEGDGNAHGVFLLNSNAMEVEVQPMPALTYRTTGGILDFYILLGPSADYVVQQYTGLIGRPFMPPFWALGFHLCRYGYQSSEKTQEIIDRNRAANMPYDTQWNDIDYMDRHLDFTYDHLHYSSLVDVVQDLHSHGQHYVMIVDPGISIDQTPGSYLPYDEGISDNVFVKDFNGSPIVGVVWPGKTVFPDWTHPNVSDYWFRQASRFHQQIPYDGLWIDMNEPSNFVEGSTKGCIGNDLDDPPFVPVGIAGGKLTAKTLCASAKQYLSYHYNLHAMYGYGEMVATMSALKKITQKRSIVISRSTFPGSGVHGGHWTGDNKATWDDLMYSVSGIMNFQLFGIPLVGADICGFSGDTTPELCARWMQLGAFYPFMRNHNDLTAKDQDPAAFDSKTQDIMREALKLRYTLLPFLYYLFFRSHVDGSPVVRPVFFQYPVSDYNATLTVDVQFMWGSCLLITPAISQDETVGLGYLPKDTWYDFYTHEQNQSSGQWINFDTPAERINLKVRGGSIFPVMEPNVTTTYMRQNPLFGLFVALATDGTASGELYWDDGDQLDAYESGMYNHIGFSVQKNTLQSIVIKSGYISSEGMPLNMVTILGVSSDPQSVMINGKKANYKYDIGSQTIYIDGGKRSLLSPITIGW
ncbi:hypothetical protein ACJMK2_033851 [Sinanodonta woodiana]|uniref:P-type domain-containing protein n=1 Tax=Sinanodonta woodiana TaxID=1069815 RepID=A0ABD3WTG2_SINWO